MAKPGKGCRNCLVTGILTSFVIIVIFIRLIIYISNLNLDDFLKFKYETAQQTGITEKERINLSGNKNLESELKWKWKGRAKSIQILIKKEDLLLSKYERDNFKPSYGRAEVMKNGDIRMWDISFPAFFNELYIFLETKNNIRLKELRKKLLDMKPRYNLNYNKFAQLVITAIQHTRYVIPATDWGIYTPMELLASNSGDCDSRTLVLHSLLRSMGYRTVFIYSERYSHVMLGISIRTSGSYLTLGSERYYFCETTNTGWQIGMIPPEFGNKKYWIILKS